MFALLFVCFVVFSLLLCVLMYLLFGCGAQPTMKAATVVEVDDEAQLNTEAKELVRLAMDERPDTRAFCKDPRIHPWFKLHQAYRLGLGVSSQEAMTVQTVSTALLGPDRELKGKDRKMALETVLHYAKKMVHPEWTPRQYMVARMCDELLAPIGHGMGWTHTSLRDHYGEETEMQMRKSVELVLRTLNDYNAWDLHAILGFPDGPKDAQPTDQDYMWTIDWLLATSAALRTKGKRTAVQADL